MILQYTPKRFLLLLVDLLIMYGSLYASIWMRVGDRPTYEYFLTLLPSFLIIFGFSVIIYFSYGLYDKPTLRLIRELPSRTAVSQIITALIAIIFFYTLPDIGVAPKTILFLYIALSGLSIILWRRMAFNIILRYRKMSSIAVGSGSDFTILTDEIERNPHSGISLLAKIDVDTYNLASIERTLDTLRPDAIIIDLYDIRIKPYFASIYQAFYSRGMLILDVVDVFEDTFHMIPLEQITQEWMFRHVSKQRRYHILKYILDVLICVPVLILFLLLLPFIYIAIKLEDRGPIFFSQMRIGKHGIPFTIYKIRSMTNIKTDSSSDSVKRVTKLGAFMRKTRIDELPQVWNVFAGDLALVGPRPETPTLADEYRKKIPFYDARHLVRPGLTGWAQVEQKGAPRFGIDITQTHTKLAYDMYYLKHASLLLDISIIVRTIHTILSRKGE